MRPKTFLNLSLLFVVIVGIWTGRCVSMPTSDQNGDENVLEEDLMMRFKAEGTTQWAKSAECVFVNSALKL